MSTHQRPVEWMVSREPVPYAQALAAMTEHVDAIAASTAAELVWLLEHPALYTAGTIAKPADLLDPHRFPVHITGRGGQYTYHGPGQRVSYLMLDVRRRFGDVRMYVAALEGWLIDALASASISYELMRPVEPRWKEARPPRRLPPPTPPDRRFDAILPAATGAALILVQRELSTPVRRARRELGTLDGVEPMERSLRILPWASVLLGAALVTAGLMVYLVYALLKPEQL